MKTRLLLATFLAALAACKIGGSTETERAAADCSNVAATCGSNSDCCSYGCQQGVCVPNPIDGGVCRTSPDCAGMLCKGGACNSTATCRDDQDVCDLTTYGGCCSGRCVTGLCLANHPPVASVSLSIPGTLVPYRAAVPLQNDSSDPDAGDVLRYEWSVVSAPPGSTATIQSPTLPIPTYVPDQLGSYTLQVRVTDGPATQPGRLTATATVSFTAIDTPPLAQPRATNTVPVATPGVVGHIPRRSTVTLDGTSSRDPDGDAITSFQWSIVSQPTGSEATLLNPTSQIASLVLPSTANAAEGDYVVQLAVFNAQHTEALITIHADDTTPVARLNNPPPEGNALTTYTLDASTSSDADKDPLTFTWATTAWPAGSLHHPPTPIGDGSMATFTPDFPGAYTVTVTVKDPALHENSASQTITVYKAVRDLNHHVVDAEYSRALDRIVAVGPHPDQTNHPGEGLLDLYDPKSASQPPSNWIALPKPATCVGLSPDGLYAIVGHLKAISYVDLTTKKVLTTVNLNYDVADAALGDRRNYKGATPHFAHFVFSGALSSQPLQTIILNCTLDANGYCSASNPPEIVVGSPLELVAPASRIKIRPEATGTAVSRLWVASTGQWWAYDINTNNGTNSGAVWVSYSPLFSPFYGGVWVADDGDYIFNENGNAYYGRTTATVTEMYAAGILGGTAWPIATLDYSTAAGFAIAVDRSTQMQLTAYDASNFGQAWTVPLPKWVAKVAQGRGRFAFFDSTGAHRYAIVASTTGTDTDAALVDYCPDSQGLDTCP